MRKRAVKETIGCRLRLTRKALGISQRDAAKQIGITPVYLCFLEHDQHEPSLRVLRRIAKVYKTTVGDLMI